MSKEILADLHTHTISSQHALSTLHENVMMAEKRGLQFIATTDHLYYVQERIPRLNELARLEETHDIRLSGDVSLIPGVELNLNHAIVNSDKQRITNKTTWRPVGFHSWFVDRNCCDVANIPQLFYEAVTSENAVKPTAFAHIERGLTACRNGDDIGAVITALYQIVDVASENDIFLEINNASLRRGTETVALMKQWISYAKERGAKFCLGTDAHYCDSVGDFSDVLKLFESIDMRNVYILNYDYDALQALLPAERGYNG